MCTTQQLSSEERAASGTSDDLIRLAVGLETSEDLIADLDNALRVATSTHSAMPEKMPQVNHEGVIRSVCATALKQSAGASAPQGQRIAVVGLSNSDARPSYRVARKMQVCV